MGLQRDVIGAGKERGRRCKRGTMMHEHANAIASDHQCAVLQKLLQGGDLWFFDGLVSVL